MSNGTNYSWIEWCTSTGHHGYRNTSHRPFGRPHCTVDLFGRRHNWIGSMNNSCQHAGKERKRQLRRPGKKTGPLSSERHWVGGHTTHKTMKRTTRSQQTSSMDVGNSQVTGSSSRLDNNRFTMTTNDDETTAQASPATTAMQHRSVAARSTWQCYSNS